MLRARWGMALAGLTAVMIAGCGTTVPLTQQGQLASQAAGSAGDGGVAAPSATGSASDPTQLVVPAAPGATSGAGASPVTAAAPMPGTVGTVGPTPAVAASTTSTTLTTVSGKTVKKTTSSAKPGSTTKAGPSATSSGVPSSAAVAAPLQVGIAYLDNSGSTAALGGSTSTSLTQGTAAMALVAGINAAGGLDGRKLVPVYYPFDTQDDNYSQDATTACDMFTQDNHVSVVLDSAFGTIGGFRQCLQSAGVIDIGDNDEGDAVSSMQANLHANTQLMNTDRLYGSVLQQLAATGYLKGNNQIGMVVEDCPEDEAAYTNTLVPLIKKLGLKAAIKTTVECTTGFDSAATDATALSNDIITFRQDGVDRVMFVSIQEAALLGLFAEAANAQSYTPGYLLSSNASAQSLRSDLPAAQQPQINGVGNEPFNDVDDTGVAFTASESRCLALMKAGGQVTNGYSDNVYVFQQCSPLLLLESALKADGGNSAAIALMTAVNGLGSSFSDPGMVGNSAVFSSTRHDGPNEVEVFGYVASCTCIHYSGQPLTSYGG